MLALTVPALESQVEISLEGCLILLVSLLCERTEKQEDEEENHR
jgi:hypothetical protein